MLGVLFLTFLDTTIVSVTLGDLETDISAGVIPLQWVINAYALVFASLMLLGGALADRYGRRLLMLVGIVVFAGGLGAVRARVRHRPGHRRTRGHGARRRAVRARARCR